MLYGVILAAFGAISLASGIACKIVGKVEIRDAIYRYNKSSLLGNNNATTINYEIGFIPSGIGMKLTF